MGEVIGVGTSNIQVLAKASEVSSFSRLGVGVRRFEPRASGGVFIFERRGFEQQFGMVKRGDTFTVSGVQTETRTDDQFAILEEERQQSVAREEDIIPISGQKQSQGGAVIVPETPVDDFTQRGTEIFETPQTREQIFAQQAAARRAEAVAAERVAQERALEESGGHGFVDAQAQDFTRLPLARDGQVEEAPDFGEINTGETGEGIGRSLVSGGDLGTGLQVDIGEQQRELFVPRDVVSGERQLPAFTDVAQEDPVSGQTRLIPSGKSFDFDFQRTPSILSNDSGRSTINFSPSSVLDLKVSKKEADIFGKQIATTQQLTQSIRGTEKTTKGLGTDFLKSLGFPEPAAEFIVKDTSKKFLDFSVGGGIGAASFLAAGPAVQQLTEDPAGTIFETGKDILLRSQTEPSVVAGELFVTAAPFEFIPFGKIKTKIKASLPKSANIVFDAPGKLGANLKTSLSKGIAPVKGTIADTRFKIRQQRFQMFGNKDLFPVAELTKKQPTRSSVEILGGFEFPVGEQKVTVFDVLGTGSEKGGTFGAGAAATRILPEGFETRFVSFTAEKTPSGLKTIPIETRGVIKPDNFKGSLLERIGVTEDTTKIRTDFQRTFPGETGKQLQLFTDEFAPKRTRGVIGTELVADVPSGKIIPELSVFVESGIKKFDVNELLFTRRKETPILRSADGSKRLFREVSVERSFDLPQALKEIPARDQSSLFDFPKRGTTPKTDIPNVFLQPTSKSTPTKGIGIGGSDLAIKPALDIKEFTRLSVREAGRASVRRQPRTTQQPTPVIDIRSVPGVTKSNMFAGTAAALSSKQFNIPLQGQQFKTGQALDSITDTKLDLDLDTDTRLSFKSKIDQGIRSNTKIRTVTGEKTKSALDLSLDLGTVLDLETVTATQTKQKLETKQSSDLKLREDFAIPRFPRATPFRPRLVPPIKAKKPPQKLRASRRRPFFLQREIKNPFGRTEQFFGKARGTRERTLSFGLPSNILFGSKKKKPLKKKKRR